MKVFILIEVKGIHNATMMRNTRKYAKPAATPTRLQDSPYLPLSIVHNRPNEIGDPMEGRTNEAYKTMARGPIDCQSEKFRFISCWYGEQRMHFIVNMKEQSGVYQR